jgi:hypothetical protein
MNLYRLLVSGDARRAAAALLSLAALCWPQARATTFARMSVRELAQRSTFIARARCVNVASVADRKQVWTLSIFEVAESWKGNLPPRLTLRLPGGDAAGLRVTVEGVPRFTVGEDVVLFLTEERGRQMNILSWAQGTFRIRKDPRTAVELAVQDTAGIQVFDVHSGAGTMGGSRQLPLAALRARVARALEGAAR